MLALITLPFTRNRWSALLRQCFDQYEERGTPLSIPVPENSLADSIHQLGVVTIQGNQEGETLSLAVIEIVASDAVALLRNRVGIRNLAARLLSPGTADGLLIATTQPGRDAWRFTFIHRETRFNDEGALERVETPTRRYTYVLGPGESCRTPDSRFHLLARHRGATTITHVLDAFSVEKLSDEFFTTYKRHYGDFCNHLIGNSSSPKPSASTLRASKARNVIVRSNPFGTSSKNCSAASSSSISSRKKAGSAARHLWARMRRFPRNPCHGSAAHPTSSGKCSTPPRPTSSKPFTPPASSRSSSRR